MKREIDKNIDAITQIKDWRSILDWGVIECLIENPPISIGPTEYLDIMISISFDGPNPDPNNSSLKQRMVVNTHCQLNARTLLLAGCNQIAEILGMEAKSLGQHAFINMLKTHGTDYSGQMEEIAQRRKEMAEDQIQIHVLPLKIFKRYEEHRHKQIEIERIRRSEAKLAKQKQRKKAAPWGVN